MEKSFKEMNVNLLPQLTVCRLDNEIWGEQRDDAKTGDHPQMH
jgi:hypothetical protein